MRLYPFTARYPRLDQIPSVRSLLKNAKREYAEYERLGFYQEDEDENYYLYRIEKDDRSYNGILACIDIAEYDEGNIVIHEHTLATKEQTMMQLILQREAMIKPVVLTHEHMDLVDELLKENRKVKPIIDTTVDGDTHTIWAITKKKQRKKIESAYDRIDKVYIADGHHRCSTSSLLNASEVKGKKFGNLRYDRLMCAFFAYDEMDILAFHRIVDRPIELSVTQMIARMSRYLDIEYLSSFEYPRETHNITLIVDQEHFNLRWRQEILDNLEADPYDARMLDEYVLQHIFGIEDTRTDHRVRYIPGTTPIESIRLRLERQPQAVALLLHPLPMEAFKSATTTRQILPPKSTWFEPRMHNGLLVSSLKRG